MMNSFWSTMKGQMLADTLIRELPNLNDRPQHAVFIDCEKDFDDLIRRINEKEIRCIAQIESPCGRKAVIVENV